MCGDILPPQFLKNSLYCILSINILCKKDNLHLHTKIQVLIQIWSLLKFKEMYVNKVKFYIPKYQLVKLYTLYFYNC